MALQAVQLASIAGAIGDPQAPGLLAQLRGQFPALTFTQCSDDDVLGVRPVIETARFNLYLIDASQHCLRLTSDHELASGVVIAAIDAT